MFEAASPRRGAAVLVASALLAVGCGEGSRVPTQGGRVVITAIAPDTLVAGGAVTISGRGFSTVSSEDVVSVDGVVADVIAASATQLTATVPTTVPCVPAHDGSVLVTTVAASATASHPIRAAIPRALGVGQSMVITDAGAVGCNELTGGGAQYVMNVFNAEESTSPSSGFTLQGNTTVPLTASLRSANPRGAPAMPDAIAPRAGQPLTPGDPFAYLAVRRARHEAMLARNLAFVAAHRGALGRLRRANRAAGRSVAALQSPPAVGTLRTLHVPFDCTTDSTTIVARVVAVSQRAVIYEDTAWPLAGQLDTQYPQLGQIFDTQLYPSDSANFADPLATDSLTDDDGRIAMVFTPLVFARGIGGFVNSCDLLPPGADNPGSNFGEYFYGELPSDLSLDDGPQGWLAVTQPLVVHETKHLAAFEWDLTHGGTGAGSAWLEEGLAVNAEELWARTFVYHVPWKGNTGYSPSFFCDFHLDDPQCNFRPRGMNATFGTIYEFLDTPNARSPFGPIAGQGLGFEEVAWSLVRWSVDRYATDEPSAFRGLTQDQSLIGLAKLSAHLGGRPPAQMIGNWSLAMVLDGDSATAGNADVDFPTWNLYDILAGFRRDFPSEPVFQIAVPVVDQLSSNFSLAGQGIVGGGFTTVRMATDASPIVDVGLTGTTPGSPPPTELRIAIVRVR